MFRPANIVLRVVAFELTFIVMPCIFRPGTNRSQDTRYNQHCSQLEILLVCFFHTCFLLSLHTYRFTTRKTCLIANNSLIAALYLNSEHHSMSYSIILMSVYFFIFSPIACRLGMMEGNAISRASSPCRQTGCSALPSSSTAFTCTPDLRPIDCMLISFSGTARQ